jgi:glycosyltransferase involved in cell wall biosynthesis
LTEGYGLPPLEAMRVGTPTLVTDQVPSVHDRDAPEPAAAVVVDPLDVEGIAAGLAAVLTDEPLRSDLATRGRAYALARTWHGAAQAHIDLWRSLR